MCFDPFRSRNHPSSFLSRSELQGVEPTSLRCGSLGLVTQTVMSSWYEIVADVAGGLDVAGRITVLGRQADRQTERERERQRFTSLHLPWFLSRWPHDVLNRWGSISTTSCGLCHLLSMHYCMHRLHRHVHGGCWWYGLICFMTPRYLFPMYVVKDRSECWRCRRWA